MMYNKHSGPIPELLYAVLGTSDVVLLYEEGKSSPTVVWDGRAGSKALLVV